MYRLSVQWTTPSTPVSSSQGDSPREKNMGKVCTGSRGNGLHPVRQSVQVRETVQEKRTWERYVQALRAIDYTQYASQFKSGRQSKGKEHGKGMYRLSGQWTTPRMPVSSSQGDSLREKNMGKVCKDPQGNGLHPVCQSFQVRETVQEKRTWERYVQLLRAMDYTQYASQFKSGRQSKRKEHGKGNYRLLGQRKHTQYANQFKSGRQSKRKEHGKGMYRHSGQWSTPSMPVSSSQGAVQEKRTWERYVQALRAMDYTQYASQFKSGRQSKRKEYWKGMYKPSGQWTTPSMPVSSSQGDSPREKNMGKVCTGTQGNGLHPVRQSVQVRETVQEKRTWERYVQALRAMDYTQYASQFKSGRQSKRKEHGKGMYRLSGQWTTPSMPVSSSQGDSLREKNMGKVCTDPQGNGLHPVCQSFQVRETVQEKRTWERYVQSLRAMDYTQYASQFKSGRQSKRKEHGKGNYRLLGQRKHTQYANQFKSGRQSKRKEYWKGMYKSSGQWTTPSMPVSSSQGDSPREKNMGKVCTGSQGNGLHPVCQSVQVRETVQEERVLERYVQALRAMDYTQYASQFKSGRQSKRKEHGKGMYRHSGQWTTPRMPVSSSQRDSPREKNMGKVCTGTQGNGLHPVRQSVQVRETVQEKRTWERYVQALRAMDYTQYASQLKSGSSPREKNMGKVCTGSQGNGPHPVCQSVQVRETVQEKRTWERYVQALRRLTTPSMPVSLTQGDSPRENMGKVYTGSQGNGLHPGRQSVQVREQSKRKEHGKGMYRPSGQWTAPSMPVSSSQGDSPREKNMGKVCTGTQGVRLHPVCQSVQVRETVQEKRVLERYVQALTAMDYTQYASQFKSGRQSKRKEHGKGMYRLSGQWTTHSMPVSSSQGAVQEKITWKRYIQALRVLDYTQDASQFESVRQLKRKEHGKGMYKPSGQWTTPCKSVSSSQGDSRREKNMGRV